MSEPKPQSRGVVAIVHDPEGDVLAVCADFDLSGCGGFTLFEAQRMRAREAVRREAILKLCHPDVLACMDQYNIQQLFSKMVSQKGYSSTVIPIGYEEDVERERERRR